MTSTTRQARLLGSLLALRGEFVNEIDPDLVSVKSMIPNEGEVVLCRCRLDGGTSFQLWPARYVRESWQCVFDRHAIEDVSHWKPFPIVGDR